MPIIVADAMLPAKLEGLTEPAEIVDVKGRRLRRFVPEPVEPDLLIPRKPEVTR